MYLYNEVTGSFSLKLNGKEVSTLGCSKTLISSIPLALAAHDLIELIMVLPSFFTFFFHFNQLFTTLAIIFRKFCIF